jgi:hypothetical protein
VTDWVATGRAKGFKDDGAVVTVDATDEAAADRKFMRAVWQAVHAFEATPGARLEVVACVSNSPDLDPLRLQVTKVKRAYGGLQFLGPLGSDSVIVPELRAGLPMNFDTIQEFRLNDEPPVRRL